MKKPTTDIYQGDDGAWVVHIDTEENIAADCNAQGPTPLRVYINDGAAVYENPPLPPMKGF